MILLAFLVHACTGQVVPHDQFWDPPWDTPPFAPLNMSSIAPTSALVAMTPFDTSPHEIKSPPVLVAGFKLQRMTAIPDSGASMIIANDRAFFPGGFSGDTVQVSGLAFNIRAEVGTFRAFFTAENTFWTPGNDDRDEVLHSSYK